MYMYKFGSKAFGFYYSALYGTQKPVPGFIANVHTGSKAEAYCQNEGLNYKVSGHDFSSSMVTKPATCAEKGEKINTCSICGATQTAEIPATGNHKYGSYSVTKAATVFATGKKVRECTVCGKTDSKTIDKLTPTIKLNKTKLTIKITVK